MNENKEHLSSQPSPGLRLPVDAALAIRWDKTGSTWRLLEYCKIIYEPGQSGCFFLKNEYGLDEPKENVNPGDWVVKDKSGKWSVYRETPSVQPIADSKEVPEELKQMADAIAEEVCPHEVYGVCRKQQEKSSNWLDYMEGAKSGAIAMYHKMEEELQPLTAKFEALNKLLLQREKEAGDAKVLIESHGRVITKVMKEADELSDQLDAARARINSDGIRIADFLGQGEQIAAYRKALEYIRLHAKHETTFGIDYTVIGRVAKEALDKYPESAKKL